MSDEGEDGRQKRVEWHPNAREIGVVYVIVSTRVDGLYGRARSVGNGGKRREIGR